MRSVVQQGLHEFYGRPNTVVENAVFCFLLDFFLRAVDGKLAEKVGIIAVNFYLDVDFF